MSYGDYWNEVSAFILQLTVIETVLPLSPPLPPPLFLQLTN